MHLTLAIFTLIVNGISSDATPTFGDRYIVHGVSHLQEGRTQSALDALNQALSMPLSMEHKAEASLVAARASLLLSKAQDALSYLQDTSVLKPLIPDVILTLEAQAYGALGRWEEAKNTWGEVLKHDFLGDQKDGLFALADINWKLQDVEQATTHYERALLKEKRTERAKKASFNLAKAYATTQRWSDARRVYRGLALYYPSHPLGYEADKQIENLSRQGHIEALRPADHLSRIQRLLNARSVDEAEKRLHELRNESLSLVQRKSLRLKKGQLHYRRNQYSKAVRVLLPLLRDRDRNTVQEAAAWLARSYSQMGQGDRAIKLHLEMAKNNKRKKDRKKHLYRAAWLAYNQSNYSESLSLFKNYIAKYPKESTSADALWFLAWNSYHLAHLIEADAYLLRLRKDFPRSVLTQRALYWQGRVARLLGKVPNALKYFAAAYRQKPNSYYGILAQQKLHKGHEFLQEPERTTPMVVAGTGEKLARLLLNQVSQASGKAIAQSTKKTLSGSLSWGENVFDWEGSEGRRVLLLLKLGFSKEAWMCMRNVPVLDEVSGHDLRYVKARLHLSFGNYHGSYRLIARGFRSELKKEVSSQNQSYFHLAYPNAFPSTTHKAALEFDIEESVILAVMRQESAFRTTARSWASAQGLMQIIPRTGMRIAQALDVPDYDVRVLSDPSHNIRYGAWYLSELLTKFDQHIALAVGAYNAGPRAVARWVKQRPATASDEFIEDVPYVETRRYIKRVMANIAMYRRLREGQSLELPLNVPAQVGNNIDF
jgi:soluble lytic murein transglycosylase